jgi:hypothetical protein
VSVTEEEEEEKEKRVVTLNAFLDLLFSSQPEKKIARKRILFFSLSRSPFCCRLVLTSSSSPIQEKHLCKTPSQSKNK